MYKLIFVTLIICFTYSSCKSQEKCSAPIYFDAVDLKLNFNKSNDSTIIKGDSVWQILIYNCYGKSKIVCKSKDKKVFSGTYLGDSSIKIDSLITYDIFSQKEVVTVSYFYRPKRNGKWKYWNIEGDLVRVELYDKGRLVSVKGH